MKFLLFMRSGLKNWGEDVWKMMSFFNENTWVVSGVGQIQVSGLKILSSCLHEKCVVWNLRFLIFWYYEKIKSNNLKNFLNFWELSLTLSLLNSYSLLLLTKSKHNWTANSRVDNFYFYFSTPTWINLNLTKID